LPQAAARKTATTGIVCHIRSSCIHGMCSSFRARGKAVLSDACGMQSGRAEHIVADDE
jgi:hypothetical protein